MTTTPIDQDATAKAGAAADPSAAARDMANLYVGKARAFAKARPAATAALVGVVGLAILNSLRGRQ